LGRDRARHVYRERHDDPLPPFTAEELPDWTSNVGPLAKDVLKLSMPPGSLDADGNLVLEEHGKGPNFARRNIVTNTGWFYTLYEYLRQSVACLVRY
jgi:hypothetical protein